MDDRASYREAGVMKMQVFHVIMQELMSEPEKGSFWAYNACQQTRCMGQRIFECFPDPSEVEKLLNIIEDLPNKVRNAKKDGEFKDYLNDFADSIEKRMDTMRSYIKDMSAPFGEDEPDKHGQVVLHERKAVPVRTKGIGKRILQLLHQIYIGRRLADQITKEHHEVRTKVTIP
jgi:hypothetical protein